ncbi:hypothetical protein QFZ98_000489 [Paraburkholderia youngii]
MDAVSREALKLLAAQLGNPSREALVAQLGHLCQSMTEFYLRAAQAEACIINGRTRTNTGKCRVDSHSPTIDLKLCLSAGMLPVKPSALNLSQYVQEARRRTLISRGLLRDWSDLDRTQALAAHLAALDERFR